MAGAGRPGPASALTPKVRGEIVKRLASGCTLQDAAESARLTRRVVQKWLAVGREAETRLDAGQRLTAKQTECLALLDAERTARAEFKVRSLARIQQAAKDDWRADAWLLERKFPEEFAPRGRGVTARPNAGRPIGSTSAPDRAARPGPLHAVA